MGKLIRFQRKAKAEDAAARPLFPPFQSGASDARPASFKSDAATSADSPRPGTGPDPEIAKKRLRRRRAVILALVLVFVGGTAAAFFGDRGYLDVRRQRQQYEELKVVHDARVKRVEALRKEIDRLNADPSALERIAREDLGFSAKGEITLLLPGADPTDPHRLDAKDGSAIVPRVRSTP
jgi:cell division protein FtsB